MRKVSPPQTVPDKGVIHITQRDEMNLAKNGLLN
jgi:hypothetical protein